MFVDKKISCVASFVYLLISQEKQACWAPAVTGRKASSFLSCSKTQERSALRGGAEMGRGTGGSVHSGAEWTWPRAVGGQGKRQDPGGPSFLAVPWIPKIAEATGSN